MQRAWKRIGLALWGCLALGTGLPGVQAAAPVPQWIWGEKASDGEMRFFRRVLELPARPRKALLTVAADDQAVLSVNEKAVGQNDSFQQPTSVDVSRLLQAGRNELSLVARNGTGPAGLVARLEVTLADGRSEAMVSDASWETSADGATGWTRARELGPHGMAPWGEVLKMPVATPASALTVAPGFQVELLRSAEFGEGSWVSLAFDPKGRLWISPQGSEPLLRGTLQDGRLASLDPVDLPVRAAMGMLWAFDSFYVNGRGTNGLALYRLRDTNGDDALDACQALHAWKGDGGEHGPHGLATDGTSLFVVNGNFVDVPAGVAPSSPVRHYADDVVLPRMEDGRGFGSGRKPPGGYVLRMQPDGSGAELFSAGQRNAYDLAFNEDGELFTFDSDMEWDWGTPWYRPIRVLHCFAGADHGFREGSAKWPSDLPDSVGPVVEVGIGSPTGVASGKGARFPAAYRRALYVMDWSYGRILAMHLRPQGASYTGTFEPFVQGKPLNVTDLAVGPDGAMYFITGGRGTQSGLYRVSHVGAGPDATVDPTAGPVAGAAARAQRRELEGWMRVVDPEALGRIWEALGSDDRVLRHAARVALERQPVASWRARALAETNAVAGLGALMALVRVGATDDQAAILKALAKWPLDGLGEEAFATKLRVIGLSLARQGMPGDDLRTMALQKLGRQFPARSWRLNRDLSALLVALGSPDVVRQALELRDRATTQAEALHYQATLRLATNGWDMGLRQRYFAWFHRRPALARLEAEPRWFGDVGQRPANGASMDGFLKTMRQQALARVPDDEKGPLAPWVTGAAVTNGAAAAAVATTAGGPGHARAFVKHWTTPDVAGLLGTGDVLRGKGIWREAQCAACHRLGGEGGAVGPDLTGVGSRYARIDILKSITEPSAVVSEQFQATLFTLRDGGTVAGRVTGEAGGSVQVLVDPVAGTTRTLRLDEVLSREASPVSMMPEGLMDHFTAQEMADLVAYLERPGN